MDGVRGAIRGRYVFRTTSVEENHRNLVALVKLIVFSLSPVPLAATSKIAR
jgi:hypothetical protein